MAKNCKASPARGKSKANPPRSSKNPSNVGTGSGSGKRPMPFGKKVNTGIQVGD